MVAAPVLRADEIGVRRAIDATRRFARPVGSATVHRVSAEPLEPIEIHVAGDGRVTGYMVVGGERRELPAGSTLDAERGVFYWQPGAAFIGQLRAGVRARWRGAAGSHRGAIAVTHRNSSFFAR